MKKIEIKESTIITNKFRLIINVSDDYSVGVLLSKAELNTIKTEIEEVLEKAKSIGTSIQVNEEE